MSEEMTGVRSAEETEALQRPIEVIEGEILFYKAQAGGAILEIGNRLIEAKKQLKHGEWEAWLAEKVDFSARSAQRFMRLAKEYGKNDTVALLGPRKALALLALEGSDREEFVAEKHEINGEEKTAQDMSVEELEELVRLRKEAQEAQMERERLLGEIQEKDTRLAAAQAEAKRAKEDREKVEAQLAPEKERAQRAEKEAKTSRAAADKIARELANLKAKPVDVAVREPSEEEIAAKAAPAVEAARAEAAEEIRRLEKALAAADPDTAAFKVHFAAWQETWGKLMDTLGRIEAADSAKADKLRTALWAAAERMRV